jgi:hypothetical protein
MLFILLLYFYIFLYLIFFYLFIYIFCFYHVLANLNSRQLQDLRELQLKKREEQLQRDRQASFADPQASANATRDVDVRFNCSEFSFHHDSILASLFRLLLTPSPAHRVASMLLTGPASPLTRLSVAFPRPIPMPI